MSTIFHSIFTSIYDRFRKDHEFPEIEFDEFTVTKAQELLKDKFSFKLERNPFVVIAVPFTCCSARAVFFGFKDTEKMYGIALDDEFRLAAGTGKDSITKYINTDAMLTPLKYLNRIVNTRIVKQDNLEFKKIEEFFKSINVDQGSKTEAISLLDLRVLSGDEYATFKCNYSVKDDNQPSCKFYKNGGYKNECSFYSGEYSDCRSFKAIEESIIEFRKKV